MSDDASVRVDQQKVRDLFLGEGDITIGELTRVSCAFGDAPGSVSTPMIARPAQYALQEALRMLSGAFGTLQAVMRNHHEDVHQSMRDYAGLDQSGRESMGAISAGLTAPPGTDPHRYLASQPNQVAESVAEIGVWRTFDPAMVRTVPGDMLTTAGRLLMVGPDGRYYENGVAVSAPAGEEVRMYRRMTAPPDTVNGGVAA